MSDLGQYVGRSVETGTSSLALQVNQVSSALRSQPSRGGSTQAPLPSEKQLYHLVQQIQLAVQSGHLNAQVS